MLKNIPLLSFFSIFLIESLLIGATLADSTATAAPDNQTFSCSDSEADLIDKSVTSAGINGNTIYVGYQQVSANNQNPIVARFDSGVQVWCRTDYETSGDDNRATGLWWDGTNSGLYLIFSATGTQGSSDGDFRRFAENGWLSSYTDGSPGGGGGPKVSIVAKANAADGSINSATFVTAVLSSGKTNSLVVDQLSSSGDSITIQARSWYSPRNPDKTAMSCEGSSPFTYTLTLSADLSTALNASAENCVGNSQFPPNEVTITPEVAFVGMNTFTAEVGPENVELPIRFTWRVNGDIVRTVSLDSRIDQLNYEWASTAEGQTIEVSVENAQSAAPLDSQQVEFSVVPASQLFVPMIQN
ncbi:MAG: hypothetical protein AAGD96_24565 [Chloroflexota bacterium]